MKITNFTERQNAYADLEKFEQALELFENYDLNDELIKKQINKITYSIKRFENSLIKRKEIGGFNNKRVIVKIK